MAYWLTPSITILDSTVVLLPCRIIQPKRALFIYFQKVYAFYSKKHKKVEQKLRWSNQLINHLFSLFFFLSPYQTWKPDNNYPPPPSPFTSVCLHSSDKQINILSLLIFTSPILLSTPSTRWQAPASWSGLAPLCLPLWNILSLSGSSKRHSILLCRMMSKSWR